MNFSKIKEHIKAKKVGNTLFVYRQTDSTNNALLKLAGDGSAGDGSVAISDSQTAGRGRLGRAWKSPPGCNLYLSVMLCPDISPQESAVFTFLASCALFDTFSDYGVGCSIKWPNDILVDGKKISGVLTELGISDGKVDHLIIGIGVNLNLSREFIKKKMKDISDKTTSLSIVLGEETNREEFAGRLISSIDRFYAEFRNHGSSAVIKNWSDRWGFEGKEVSIDVSGEIVSGTAERVDENGFLYLRTRDGTLKRVIAGDAVF